VVARKSALLNRDIEQVKTAIVNEVETRRSQLMELSQKIHSHPELAFQEFQAVEWLADYLASNGFSVEKGICDLPTAFRARYGQGKPVIAFLAEYDALPKLGHACGHNIISTSAVGAGVAAKGAVDRFGGSLRVIGTPAEEMYGGKVLMAEKDAFRDIDAAMMAHPGRYNAAVTKLLACQNLEVEFFGRASHAAARPEEGINALEAMVQSFNAINSLRQHIKDGARIHGIITDGGQAANIVPEHTAGSFIVRAEDDEYLDELKSRVLSCFVAAAMATGARLESKWAKIRYAPLRNNMTLARLLKRNLESRDRKVLLKDPSPSFYSSDMGNVSQIIPAIHASISVTQLDVRLHSPEFAIVAASEAGVCAMLEAAEAMAMTAADILADPVLAKQIKAEFQRSKKMVEEAEEE
jgi:amidohydrolase